MHTVSAHAGVAIEVDAVLRIIVTTVTAEDGIVRSAVGEIDAMTARGTRGDVALDE